MNIPQLLIAAPHSGSGKTMVTLALMRHLHSMGMRVQPFKCGPDYLDSKVHEVAAHRSCYNLDLFMSDAEGLRARYAKAVATADVAVVEGVMGMFDGYHRSAGSSAEVAKTLGIPVVMVVNAKAMAHSVAPLLKGFATYDPEVRVVGVIFNFVGSAAHYEMLRMAAEEVGVVSLGWIARNDELRLESRHLGLTTEDREGIDTVCQRAAESLFRNVDVAKLLAVASLPKPCCPETMKERASLRIAVAKDAAFSFTYRANIEALEQMGHVVYFSPLKDDALPQADVVYLPGGYPELHAAELSSNKTMMESVRRYCEEGGAMLAECGGMIYLGQSLTLADGSTYPMAGFLDLGTTFEGARCTLGYRQVTINGVVLRGHEFHYSRSVGTLPDSAAEVQSAIGQPTGTNIYLKKRTLASYFHFYWGDGASSPISLLLDGEGAGE